jgi:hypothetical protein
MIPAESSRFSYRPQRLFPANLAVKGFLMLAAIISYFENDCQQQTERSES